MGFYESLQGRYPQADVKASTFDAFFAVANRPEIKAQLPVVTAEIEDAWIYGVPSDPLKNAQFREASRQRLVRSLPSLLPQILHIITKVLSHH